VCTVHKILAFFFFSETNFETFFYLVNSQRVKIEVGAEKHVVFLVMCLLILARL